MACSETGRKVSVVIPVYNEERTLEFLLDKVMRAPLPAEREIIIVDDGSTDGSGAVAERWAARQRTENVRLLRRKNGGKGAAVRDGIAVSTGDAVIIQDADLEYDPVDIARCIAPILEGRCGVVYGSREREHHNRCSSWRFYLGGLAVTWWIDLWYLAYLTDEPTCYKTFRGDLIRALDFENDDFGWEPEVTCKLLRLGWSIREVPIGYRPRHLAEGKKIRSRDGFRAFKIALEWRFRSMKKWRNLKYRQTK